MDYIDYIYYVKNLCFGCFYLCKITFLYFQDELYKAILTLDKKIPEISTEDM